MPIWQNGKKNKKSILDEVLKWYITEIHGPFTLRASSMFEIQRLQKYYLWRRVRSLTFRLICFKNKICT